LIEIFFKWASSGWHTVYDGCTKSEWDKAKIMTLYAIHIIAEKKDLQLTHSLMTSLGKPFFW
jgi:hypothetical protein